MELSKTDTVTIKGVAILFMLWHHLFLNATGFGSLTHSLAIVSKVCVALFLFVSGYGLTRQYCKLEKRNLQTTLQFLLRRFINFFLPFWFCFLLVVVVGNLGGHTFHDAYPATRNILKCFILDFFGQMGYDSYLKPWWFNKMILQLYLAFPILFLVIRNRFTAIIGLLGIFIVQLFAKSIPGNVFFFVEGGLPAFFLGMMTARYRFCPEMQRKSQKITFGIIAILVGGCLSFLLIRIIKDPYQAILLRALLAFCIIVAYKAFGNMYRLGVLGFVGKYATIMYLTHELIIILLPKIVYSSSYSAFVFILFTLICLTIAITVNWLEKVSRFDNLRQKWVSTLTLS